MREDRMAKDDFLEVERGSSRLARESGLLARALERMDELCNACMPRVSLLLYYVVCYGLPCLGLGWGWGRTG